MIGIVYLDLWWCEIPAALCTDDTRHCRGQQSHAELVPLCCAASCYSLLLQLLSCAIFRGNLSVRIWYDCSLVLVLFKW